MPAQADGVARAVPDPTLVAAGPAADESAAAALALLMSLSRPEPMTPLLSKRSPKPLTQITEPLDLAWLRDPRDQGAGVADRKESGAADNAQGRRAGVGPGQGPQSAR